MSSPAAAAAPREVDARKPGPSQSASARASSSAINTAFIAEQIVRRKHPKQAKRDLPSLVAQLVEPLTEQREAQARAFERFKATALMTMFREGVINVQRIADVVREWDQLSFAYEQYVERSAWQLFNAATFALKGRVTDYDTPKLHRIIDGVCQHVH